MLVSKSTNFNFINYYICSRHYSLDTFKFHVSTVHTPASTVSCFYPYHTLFWENHWMTWGIQWINEYKLYNQSYNFLRQYILYYWLISNNCNTQPKISCQNYMSLICMFCCNTCVIYFLPLSESSKPENVLDFVWKYLWDRKKILKGLQELQVIAAKRQEVMWKIAFNLYKSLLEFHGISIFFLHPYENKTDKN